MPLFTSVVLCTKGLLLGRPKINKGMVQIGFQENGVVINTRRVLKIQIYYHTSMLP
jgi:hypothetical protein